MRPLPALLLLPPLLCCGCDLGAARPTVDSFAIDLGGITAGKGDAEGVVTIDARQITSSAGLPLYHYGSFRPPRLYAIGTAPSDGVLRIGIYYRDDRGWAQIAWVRLTEGQSLPAGDLLALYQTQAGNGVWGAERLRRSLADIAYGGFPTQFPDFDLGMVFEWAPASGGLPLMELDGIRVETEAAAPVDLYGGRS